MKTPPPALRFLAAAAGWFALAAAAAAAELPRAVAPDVFISLRGVDADLTIEVGEPLFAAARLELPFETGGRIEVVPAAGTWADAVEFTLTGHGGVTLRAQPTFSPATPAVTITADDTAAGEWLFASADTARLAPGDYVVQARVRVSGGRGWQGDTTSEALRVHVVPAGAASPRTLQRALALAGEALATGAPERAAGVLDPLLATQPNDLRLLGLRAIASARGGDLLAAQICLNRAAEVEDLQRLSHPSAEIHSLRQQLFAARLGGPPPATTPPAWTKLPASVLAPLPAVRRAPAATSAAPPNPPAPPGRTAPAPAPAIAPAVSGPPAPASGASGVTTAATTSAAPGTRAGQLVPAAELTDASVAATAGSQWAATARAGSQYSAPGYSAAKATGAPDVTMAGNSPDAWCPGSQNGGLDWIEVGFAHPVRATGARVRQNLSPGAIVKVEAIATDGTAHVWWEGVDPASTAPSREIAWFGVRVPATPYPVAKLKLTLNLATRPDWEQIDAVQLVAAP